MERIFNVNHNCWMGRGGARGLVTHVWDRSFAEIKSIVEKGGLGRYKLTFERLGETTEGQSGDPMVKC